MSAPHRNLKLRAFWVGGTLKARLNDLATLTGVPVAELFGDIAARKLPTMIANGPQNGERLFHVGFYDLVSYMVLRRQAGNELEWRRCRSIVELVMERAIYAFTSRILREPEGPHPSDHAQLLTYACELLSSPGDKGRAARMADLAAAERLVDLVFEEWSVLDRTLVRYSGCLWRLADPMHKEVEASPGCQAEGAALAGPRSEAQGMGQVG